MGPNGSPHRLPSLAPTARRHADGISLLYTMLCMGPFAPSAGRVPLCGCQFAKEIMRYLLDALPRTSTTEVLKKCSISVETERSAWRNS